MERDKLAIYIHWPLCLTKCPYCDFNSFLRDNFDEKALLQALLRDYQAEAGFVGKRYVSSVFFGGGTPSLMPPDSVAYLLAQIKNDFITDETLEVTLEANPSTFEKDKFKAFKAAGITRLSIGVQSFDDKALSFLGRAHTADEAQKAIAMALDIFAHVSFDLIYGLPRQTLADVSKQLDQALAFKTSHLSLYQLTIEEKTPFFAQYQKGKFSLPSDKEMRLFYKAILQRLHKVDLIAYEVSNYAKKGAESQHNLAYWTYKDFMGIGPGAHGRIKVRDGKRYARLKEKSPRIWAQKTQEILEHYTLSEELSQKDQGREFFLMGLRLREGVTEYDLYQQTGLDFEKTLNKPFLEQAITQKFLILRKNRLKTTLAGRLKLDALLPDLVI